MTNIMRAGWMTDPLSFDPDAVWLPWNEFNNLTERAHRFLEKHAREKIESAALVFDYVFDTMVAKMEMELKSQGKTVGLDLPATHVLRRCVEEIPVDGLDWFPKGTWPELLAARALQHLHTIYCDSQHRPSLTISAGEALYYQQTGCLDDTAGDRLMSEALTAKELICLAESLSALQKVKDQQSLIGRKAANARHAENALVKRDFFAYLGEKDSRLDNVTKSAGEYCKTDRFENEVNVSKKNAGAPILNIDNAPDLLAEATYKAGLSRGKRGPRKKKEPKSC